MYLTAILVHFKRRCLRYTLLLTVGCYVLRLVKNEIWLGQDGDVNPLIVGHTKNHATDVPCSP